MAKEIEENKTYTVDEYLAMEEVAEIKHEYHRGQIVAMSGGTLSHGRIGRNINFALHGLTNDDAHLCETFNNDVKVYIDKFDAFVYPDTFMVCGDVENSESHKDAVINPVLVVEVLSKSTERYDRSAKFRQYCSLPSFKEYILIDQYEPIVDVLYREDERTWKMMTIMGLDKSVFINTLQSTISMEAIYKNVQNLKELQYRLDL